MRSLWLSCAAMFGLAAVALAHGTGPHKGPVAEWGEEEYHVEVVADAKTGTVTVYIYGSDKDLHDAKVKPIPKDTKITLSLKTDPATVLKLEASPEKTDPEGKCSKFTGSHDVLKKEQKWSGTVSAKVGDRPYSGDFGK